ncbi:MAG: DUF998 domain-containing protein [Luteimonas sp.]
MSGRWRWLGVIAAAAFAIALVAFGAMLDGFSHGRHPVALLGAIGVPYALAFNLLAFVLPGLLACLLAWRVRAVLSDASALAARLGWRLVFLSALAFTGQGLLPLDPGDLDARPSRLHAVAWTLWWVAFVPGALLLAWSAWRGPSRRRASGFAHAAAGGLVLAFATLLGASLGAAIAQRLAYAVWFAWLAWAGWSTARDAGVIRGAASGPGSSPPARR